MSWWSVLVERISYCSLLQLYFLGGRGRFTLPSQGTQALQHCFPLLQLYVVNRQVRLSFAYTVLGRPQQAVEQSIQWLKKKKNGWQCCLVT